ncbi:MAG: hypothetical protein ACJ75Z_13505 [Solirubrobacterales bacterium]
MSLLDEAIDAAGGRSRWQKAERISAHVQSSGLLMRMKGKADRFHDYGLSVATERQYAVIEPYPGEGSRGVFDTGAVRIEGTDDSVISERRDARQAFFGLAGLRRNLRWDDLDALYFAAYAMWNYMNIPFVFDRPGFEVAEGEPLPVDGESWRRLNVVFPEGFHTHCREQAFYFDDKGLLRRHDYHPDPVSSLANSAHLCDGHREFDGLVFPTERRVVPKSLRGRPLRGPTVVSLSLDSVEVR